MLRCIWSFVVGLVINGWIISDVACELTVQPDTRTNVPEGSDVKLDCSTNNELPVNWIFLPASSEKPVELFSDGVISSSLTDKLSIIGNTSLGEYGLRIVNVTVSDAGTYRCIEQGGQGPDRADALLTVVRESEYDVAKFNKTETFNDTDPTLQVEKKPPCDNTVQVLPRVGEPAASMLDGSVNGDGNGESESVSIASTVVMFSVVCIVVAICIATIGMAVVLMRRHSRIKRQQKSLTVKSNIYKKSTAGDETERLASKYIQNEKV